VKEWRAGHLTELLAGKPACLQYRHPSRVDCDGASFAGHRDNAVVVDGVPLYYRGRDILDATLASLIANDGLAEAAAVVLKGCSAGGLATILHLDYVASVINKAAESKATAAAPAARTAPGDKTAVAVPKPTLPALITGGLTAAGPVVVGLPDAGFFLDHDNTQGQPTFTVRGCGCRGWWVGVCVRGWVRGQCDENPGLRTGSRVARLLACAPGSCGRWLHTNP
jgi:hypothetical protein